MPEIRRESFFHRNAFKRKHELGLFERPEHFCDRLVLRYFPVPEYDPYQVLAVATHSEYVIALQMVYYRIEREYRRPVPFLGLGFDKKVLAIELRLELKRQHRYL